MFYKELSLNLPFHMLRDLLYFMHFLSVCFCFVAAFLCTDFSWPESWFIYINLFSSQTKTELFVQLQIRANHLRYLSLLNVGVHTAVFFWAKAKPFGWLFRMALNLIKGDHKERSIVGIICRNGMINRLAAVFQFGCVWVDVCWLICSNWHLKVVKTGDCCHFVFGSLHLLCLKVVKTAIPLPFCIGQFASVVFESCENSYDHCHFVLGSLHLLICIQGQCVWWKLLVRHGPAFFWFSSVKSGLTRLCWHGLKIRDGV